MGVVGWPMVELEADDALASAAHLAAGDVHVEKVCIWTPDKDLAKCVVDARVVQVDRKSGQIRDAADGYPGIPRIGAKTAADLIKRYGPIERFPAEVLQGERRELAMLFKNL